MSMVLHVTCWAQECVSQEDGDHQWHKLPSRCQLCLERAKWSAGEGTKKPQCPKDTTPMDETFDTEKEWNELHKDMHSEEDS